MGPRLRTLSPSPCRDPRAGARHLSFEMIRGWTIASDRERQPYAVRLFFSSFAASSQPDPLIVGVKTRIGWRACTLSVNRPVRYQSVAVASGLSLKPVFGSRCFQPFRHFGDRPLYFHLSTVSRLMSLIQSKVASFLCNRLSLLSWRSRAEPDRSRDFPFSGNDCATARLHAISLTTNGYHGCRC